MFKAAQMLNYQRWEIKEKDDASREQLQWTVLAKSWLWNGPLSLFQLQGRYFIRLSISP